MGRWCIEYGLRLHQKGLQRREIQAIVPLAVWLEQFARCPQQEARPGVEAQLELIEPDAHADQRLMKVVALHKPYRLKWLDTGVVLPCVEVGDELEIRRWICHQPLFHVERNDISSYLNRSI